MRTRVYLYLIWITLLWNVANKTQIYVHTYLCIIHDTHATLWNTPYPYILFETICIIRSTQKTHVSVLGCSSLFECACALCLLAHTKNKTTTNNMRCRAITFWCVWMVTLLFYARAYTSRSAHAFLHVLSRDRASSQPPNSSSTAPRHLFGAHQLNVVVIWGL